MKNDSLKINQNKDGTFTVEWDKEDPIESSRVTKRSYGR